MNDRHQEARRRIFDHEFLTHHSHLRLLFFCSFLVERQRPSEPSSNLKGGSNHYQRRHLRPDHGDQDDKVTVETDKVRSRQPGNIAGVVGR
jgi:hypothetical protein